MSENLADLVIRLRADFGDANSQFQGLNTNLDQAKQQSKDAGAALQGFGQSVDELIGNLKGGTLASDDFVQAMYKVIDDKVAAGMSKEVEVLDELMAALDLSGKSAKEFFGTLEKGSKAPVIPPEAVPEAMNLEQSFARLGVTSSQVLRETAEQGKMAYDAILNSGKASIADLQKAWIAYEEQRQRAAIASGEIISQAERQALAQAKAPIEELKQEIVSLEDRMKSFGDSMKDTGKLLSEVFTIPLVAVSAALIKVGNDFDQASDTIRAKTGLVGQDLEAMNKSFDSIASNVPNKLGDITTAMVTLHDRLGLMGPPLEALSTQMLNLSRITGEQVGPLADEASKVFARWKISTEDQAGALDKLYFASTQTGTSVGTMLGTLQRFAPALQEVGFSFEQSVAMIAKFEQAGLNTQRDITALQQALLKLGKAGVKDPVEGLELIIDRIQKAGSVGEANAIGLKVFGRGAVDLVDAIRAGKLSVDDFVESMNKSHGAVNKAAADTLSFSDKLKLLANQMEVALRPAAEAFLKILEDVLRQSKPLIDTVAGMAKTFADLDPAIQKVVIGTGALLAAIGPAAFVLGGFIGQVAKLIPLLGSLAATEGLAGAEAAAATGAVSFSGALAGISFVSFSAGVVATISNLNDLHDKWLQVATDMRTKALFDAVTAGKSIEDLKQLGFTIKEIGDAYQGLGKQVDLTHLTLDTFGNVVVDSAKKATETTEKYDDFGIKVVKLGEAVKGAAGAHDQHAASMGKAGQSATSLDGILNKLLGTHESHILSVQALLDKQKNLDNEVKQAQAVFDAMNKAVEAGKAPAEALAAAHDQLAKAIKAAHEAAVDSAFAEVTKELDKQAKAFDQLHGRAVAYKEIVAAFGADSPQAVAALKSVNSALKSLGQDAVDAQGALDLFEPALAKVATGFEILGNKTSDSYPKLTELMKELGHFPSLSEQIAAGLTVIVGHVDQTRDAFGFLKGSGTAALEALVASGKSAVQIITEMDQVVDQFGTVISSAMSQGVADVKSFTAAVAEADQAFRDFSSGVGSFHSQLGIDQGGGSAGKGHGKGGGGTFNLENPYWGLTPEDITAKFDDTIAMLAGSSPFSPGARAFYNSQYELEQAALNNYYATHSQLSSGSRPSAPAAGGAPAGSPALSPQAGRPTLPPEIQYFLAQGATIDQIASVRTDLQDLAKSLDKASSTISGSFAQLAPAIDQMTTQIKDSTQQQSASFMRLSDALNPKASPAQVMDMAKPGFMRLSPNAPQAFVAGGLVSGNVSNRTIVNQIEITDPNAQKLVQDFVNELQRRGVRF